MIICSKCGCAMERELVVMPIMKTWMTGSGYHTGRQRSYEEVSTEMKKRAGYKYTCINNRWWKFWSNHQVLYKKVESA